MDFDPNKAFEAIERMREAFNRAASADTSAQKLFERLADGLTQTLDKTMEIGDDPQKLFRTLMPMMIQQQMVMSSIRKLAERDPAVAQTLQTLQSDLKDALVSIIPTDLSGFNIPGLGRPQAPNDDTPAAPKPPKPKKPGNFDF